MSKKTEALAAQLVPTSKTPRADQFKIAWNLLLHLPEADEWHKAQAKCWLTYRAFDEQIRFDDWDTKIRPVVPKTTSWMKVRWDCSQGTAETWMHGKLTGDLHEIARIEKAERVFSMEPRLHEYPPTILNWLRVVSFLALRKWLMGFDGEAKGLIEIGVDRWRDVMARFHWRTHPARFTEAMGDTWALSLLMMLAQRLGMTANMPDRDWISPKVMLDRIGKEPWIVCMKLLPTTERKFFP